MCCVLGGLCGKGQFRGQRPGWERVNDGARALLKKGESKPLYALAHPLTELESSCLQSARLETQSFLPTLVTPVNSIADFTRVKMAYAYSCTVQRGLCRHHQSACLLTLLYIVPPLTFCLVFGSRPSYTGGELRERSDEWRRPWGGCLHVYTLRFANLLRQNIKDHIPYLRFLHHPLAVNAHGRASTMTKSKYQIPPMIQFSDST